ncbi:MAG: RNase adapter RapZ [Deltaproteobacteria bacterium]|nr:RNase adapter RapZ [Deltaproteobacteria bacterium]
MNHLPLDSTGNPIRVVVLSGLSGSGKSTAVHALEDIGFFCIDNLPVVLLPKVVELFPSQAGEIEQIALVVDARESRFLPEFQENIDRIRAGAGRVEVLFLDCADRVLIRRYSETRRRHPLSPEGSIEEGIRNERQLLARLRERADRVIDTTDLTPHQLRELVQQRYTLCRPGTGMNLALVSFGFKHGIPPQVDLVFDVRFLPNPYFSAELRDLDGRHKEVRDFVLGNSYASLFLEHVMCFLTTFRPLYDLEGKSYLTVGIGCTGGRHRSVAIAEELGQRLRANELPVIIQHRDSERSG